MPRERDVWVGDRDAVASTLELGAGFRHAPLESDDDRLVFAGQPLVVTDLGIGRHREVSVGCGTTSLAIPLGVESGSSRLYVGTPDGLWVVDHVSGAARRFTGPPDDDDSDSADAAHFGWLLRLSPSHDEVLALGLARKPRFAVYRIPIDGRPRSRFQLDGWPAGLDGSYAHGWVCCPAFDGGARLFDLDGRTVATLPYRFRGCAIDPSAPRIALFGNSGLFLWDLPRRKLDRLRDARCLGAAWSPDGSSVFWNPCQSQLHMLDVDARRSSQWLALRDDAYSGSEHQGYAHSPHPSPDGGLVLCRLTRSRPATAAELEEHRDWYREVSGGETAPLVSGRIRYEHVAVVIDRANRTVHAVPGWCFHDAAWLR